MRPEPKTPGFHLRQVSPESVIFERLFDGKIPLVAAQDHAVGMDNAPLFQKFRVALN